MNRRIIDTTHVWIMVGYRCLECGYHWGSISFKDVEHCLYCGDKNIVRGSCVDVQLGQDLYCEPEKPRTPTEIVEEIERLYHEDGQEYPKDHTPRLKELLYELKYMAEKVRENGPGVENASKG